MVASLEQLEKALLGAHSAGDVEAAKMLAQEIKRQKPRVAQSRIDTAHEVATNPPEQPSAAKQTIPAGYSDKMLQGLTFGLSDEILAGAMTPVELIKGVVTGEDEGKGIVERASDAFDRTAAPYRAGLSQFSADNPIGGTVAEVGGSLLTGGALAKAGLSASARAANSGLVKRVGAGVADGALYGALYGAGTGEGAASRIEQAKEGATFGAIAGAAIPIGGAAIKAGAGAVSSKLAPLLGGNLNPEVEAARRVATAMDLDGAIVSQADEATAAINNQNLLNVDRGGETVRALARSAANQNPGVRDSLASTASNRFGTQGTRAQNLIDRVMDGAVDDIDYQESLLAAASKSNRPAYEKAFRINYGDKLPAEFDEILQRVPASAVSNAVKVAKTEGRPFGQQLVASLDEAGDAVQFTRIPSMREWHYIQRGLRSAADSAFSDGVGEVGRAYKGLHRELLSAMDGVNPAYKAARQGAAAFFQADNALEAGRKFVTQSKEVRRAAKAILKMNPAEKEAFRIGFAGELRDQISKTRDRSNVIDKIFGSEQSRRKLKTALGSKAYNEFEAFVRVENAMDMTRIAVSGNSTTTRQLVELGLAQGAQAGAGAGVVGYLTGDWKGALAGAALARGVRAIGMRADQKTIEQVGRILTSENSDVLKRGVKMIAKSKKHQQALEQIQRLIESSSVAPAAQLVNQ